MAEIVNLRQARKRAARGKAEALADTNRTAFGLPKELRSAARAEQARLAARLDERLLDGRNAAALADGLAAAESTDPASPDGIQPSKPPALPDER
jgi:hypothetical protein